MPDGSGMLFNAYKAEKPRDQNGRIVYESDFDGDRDVWMMNQDGTGRKNLTSGPGRDGYPRVTRGGWTFDLVLVRDVSDR
jgi:hypothetical protein